MKINDDITKESFFKKLKIIDKSRINNNNFLEKISILSDGMSGRDIEKIVSIALNKSIVYEKEIDNKIIWDSIEEFIIGKSKNIKISDEETKRIAYHELGHAIVGKKLGRRIHKISISSKNMSLGQTFTTDYKEKLLKTKEEYIIEIKSLLGGRAAEKIFIGNISMGSQNDYVRVTNILKKYFLFNFSYTIKDKDEKNLKELKLGYVVNNFDDLTIEEKNKIYSYIKIVIGELEKDTEKILKDNKDIIEKYIKILIDKKIILEDEFTI